jgi:multidrug efflux pump subunit AcrA (membrane-fusion protein)
MLGLWLIKSYSKKLHAVTHYGSPLLAGFSVRLTIPVETSKGAVTAVPISAVSLAADGTSRVLVDRGGKQEYVTVQPGLSTGGYVEVKTPDGRLAPGQLVVVGYKAAEPTAVK